MSPLRILTWLTLLPLAVPASSAAQVPQGPSAADVRAFSAEVDRELKCDILPFWSAHLHDGATGAFVGELSNDLQVRKDAPIGCLLTSRILWTYSAAYRRTKDPAFLATAREAFGILEKRFWDPGQGGYLWRMSPDGRVVDGRKEIYGQSFAIYGLSEYYLATGDKAALDRAIEVYRLIEKHSRDRANGGYLEAFTRDWKRPPGAKLSDIGPEFPKSQNTHLHLMEAYANLLRAWPDPGLRRDLRDLAEVMITRVLSPDGTHLTLYFDADWKPRSQTISFGHDIEANWLLTETAEVLGDPAFAARVKGVALGLAKSTLEGGIDADGGILNEAGPQGITDGSKEWWQQAEGMVGFLNAYQLSGDARYFAAARRVWGFIQARIVDHERGGWFWGVTRDGKVEPGRYKIGFWKCPYHNSRACMQAVDRLDAIEAALKAR